MISLPGGEQLTVRSVNKSDENIYIQRGSLDGKELTRPYITHGEVLSGGELTFEMSENPEINLFNEK